MAFVCLIFWKGRSGHEKQKGIRFALESGKARDWILFWCLPVVLGWGTKISATVDKLNVTHCSYVAYLNIIAKVTYHSIHMSFF